MTLSFGQLALDWLDVWLTRLWHCHLVTWHFTMTMFCWYRFNHVIWLADIWLTQCFVYTTMSSHLDNWHLSATKCSWHNHDYVIWSTGICSTIVEIVLTKVDKTVDGPFYCLSTNCLSAKWFSIKRCMTFSGWTHSLESFHYL